MYVYSIYSMYHTKFAPHHKCSLTEQIFSCTCKDNLFFYYQQALKKLCTAASSVK